MNPPNTQDSRILDFTPNRYNSPSQAPFVIHIESGGKEKINIGNIDPLRLGEILLKVQANFENVRKIGPQKIEVVFLTLEEANQIVEKNLNLPEHWILYIPNFKYADWTIFYRKAKTSNRGQSLKTRKSKEFLRKKTTRLSLLTPLKFFFKSPSLPEKVKFFGVLVKVYPYIFNVLQCKTCYRFGHAAANCGRKHIFPELSTEHTNSKSGKCMLSKRCINCKGNHSALDKTCSRLIEQKEIKYTMATKNIPLSHAKNLYNSGCLNHYGNPKSTRPYSQAINNTQLLQLFTNYTEKRRRPDSPIVQIDDELEASGQTNQNTIALPTPTKRIY
ncbi:hypothetical protein TSAR_013119 [Trichomalopsis sarcophagae]|uniref:Pre-C2HC domain-containing protein n=1 Tax=Trichomalopsis sarcophagae TaxID=543379 RepID=A0A232ERN1_9HYME|nr:hypothetical protein TSAR_013119 [Trichomalopsis sarcophagae]